MAIKSKFYGEGLTFDDVLLMPAYSEVLPREVSIVTNLTKDIKIKETINNTKLLDTIMKLQKADIVDILESNSKDGSIADYVAGGYECNETAYFIHHANIYFGFINLI